MGIKECCQCHEASPELVIKGSKEKEIKVHQKKAKNNPLFNNQLELGISNHQFMGRRRSMMNNAIPLENIKTNSIHEIETPPKQINLSDLGSMGKPSKLKIARFMSLVSVPEPSKSLKVSPSHFRVEKVGRFEDQYRTLDLIGKGGYGEVKKIENRITKEIRAVKVMEKSKSQTTASFVDEIHILQKLVLILS